MVQQIKPVKGKRIRIGVLAYIADLAGCGTIRVILPSILMNQFNTPHYQFQQFFLNHFVKVLVIYNGLLLQIRIQWILLLTQIHMLLKSPLSIKF